jgi:hypothetical protein
VTRSLLSPSLTRPSEESITTPLDLDVSASATREAAMLEQTLKTLLLLDLLTSQGLLKATKQLSRRQMMPEIIYRKLSMEETPRSVRLTQT